MLVTASAHFFYVGIKNQNRRVGNNTKKEHGKAHQRSKKAGNSPNGMSATLSSISRGQVTEAASSERNRRVSLLSFAGSAVIPCVASGIFSRGVEMAARENAEEEHGEEEKKSATFLRFSFPVE